MPYAPGEAPVDKVNQKIKEGLLAIYNNPLAQEAGRNALSYYDNLIAKPATKLFTAPGILPFSDSSLASLVTPEVSVNFEDIKNIYGTETVPKTERVGVGRMAKFVDTGETKEVPVGGLENRLARGYQYIKSGADWLFGDARNAGEKMKNGVKWEDLTPSERMGGRFLPLEFWFPAGGKSAKGLQKFLDEGDYLYATDMKVLREQGKLPGSVGAKVTDTDLLKYDEKPPKDISEVEVKTNQQQIDDSINKLSNRPTIQEVKDITNKSMQEKGYTDIYGKPESVSFAAKPVTGPGKEVREKGVGQGNYSPEFKRGPTYQEIANNEKRKAIADHLKPIYDAAPKEDGKAILPAQWKNKELTAIKEKNPDIFADGLDSTRMRELLAGNVKTKAGRVDWAFNTISKGSTVEGKSLQKQVSELVGEKPGDYVSTITRSFDKQEFPTLERVNEFFSSQGIDIKKLKSGTFDEKSRARTALQEYYNSDPTLQKYFTNNALMMDENGKQLPIIIQRSHNDRSLAPGDVASQFAGMNADDIKLLGATVNTVLQPDLERALATYIKNKDVKNSKRIMKEMKDVFIGTKLNDPKAGFPQIEDVDYEWLIKNKIVARPQYDNYDEIIFGTIKQPNTKEILKGEMTARAINLAKRAYKRENKDSSKFYLELASGGIVNAADVQYAVGGGFFSKMFGKPAPYMKEEIAKTDIFSPTIKQKATLEALGPEATAVNPGQVFYSNMELSLSKANSPVKFDSEKEFYDYINAAGIGRDEVGDARIGPYISAKAKAGEPILSEDIIKITNESPLNQLTTDGYGFRSEKINVAKRDEIEGYDSAAITKGDPQYKSPKYSGTGLMAGYLPNTYRERVLQIDSDKFRGDPGSLDDPAARNHSFGDNYTIAWGRSTDRPAIINEGEIVDKATGTIINPLAVTDTKKLQEIEGKIQNLVDDPLTNIKEDDFEGISQAVKALVDKSGGRLPYDKAKKAVDAQIIQKNKQLKKLQSQFVEEEKRLKSIVDMKPQNITMTFIDEIQSDIAQAATRKSRELAAKLEVMAEQGMTFEAMQEGVNRDLLQFFADNQSVARPVGATKLELMPQYEELLAFQKQFGDMGKKRPYALTTQDFAMYDNFKVRQAEIIDSMTEEINDKLMKALYPDVPLKDRGAWSDAVLKQHLYEAAHRLFVEKDPRAPTHLGVASGDIVAGKAYNQNGSTATNIVERQLDKEQRLNRYKDALRANINTTESIGKSNLPGVGTHEFYGGPNSKAWNEEAGEVGGHYTSDIERSMRKYAEDNNSKMIIANVAVSDSRGGTVYNIIDQETAEIMGTGDTYRQAENIANQLVDEDGGRYKIKKTTEKKFDTEPVFSIPLTKEMLQLNKIYK